jgi:hypothetical protein
MKNNRIAFDARASVRSKDDNGFLHVAVSNLTKETVNPYYGREIPGWQERGLDPERVYYGWRSGKELEKGARVNSLSSRPAAKFRSRQRRRSPLSMKRTRPSMSRRRRFSVSTFWLRPRKMLCLKSSLPRLRRLEPFVSASFRAAIFQRRRKRIQIARAAPKEEVLAGSRPE